MDGENAEFDQEIYRQMARHREPRKVTVEGIELVIRPDVFAPDYFTDSAWFATHLPGIVTGGPLLEIGTGTGIIAIACALEGIGPITTTDLNPAAVINARENFAMHDLDIPVLLGDVYEPLLPGARFKYIFWNKPFNKGTRHEYSMLERAGFDPFYEGVEKYVAGAREHLLPEGRLLLGTGKAAHLADLRAIAHKHGRRLELLASEERPITWDGERKDEYRIYELVACP